MNIFNSLPADVRRALARRELARRGSTGTFADLPPDLYAQLSAGVRQIIDGVAGAGAPVPDAVRALLARLERCEATEADLQMLAAVPDGPMTALEMVQLMVEVDDAV